MDNNKVSIITPVYNGEKYIEETIRSVIAQSYSNWEMLIFNDNSKDNTLNIVKKYVELDNRIKLINSSLNVGVIKARNKLIELSVGKYIAFLDADDYWHSEKLCRQTKFMEENNVLISCTDYFRIFEDGKIINKIITKEKISYDDMLKNNYMGCLTVMYNSKELGKRYFPVREKNEDYALWLEIIKEVGNVYGINETLAYYRVLSKSRSSNKFKTAKDRWKIYREVEKLSLVKSIYYFFCYGMMILKKQNKNRG